MAQSVDVSALMDLVTTAPPREHDETRENYGSCVLTVVLISRKKDPPRIAGHLYPKSGGGGGIRTRGTFPFSGFQDRCNKPLYHPSKLLTFILLQRKRLMSKFLCCQVAANFCAARAYDLKIRRYSQHLSVCHQIYGQAEQLSSIPR